MDVPLKEDLLNACVDVVERIRGLVDRLLKRSSENNNQYHATLFNDVRRIVDSKAPRLLLVGKTGMHY